MSEKFKKGFVFEGEVLEKYKELRDKWIRLTLISSGLPILLTCIISWYNERFELFNLFGRGEIMLSLFSSTVPQMFDLFEIKKKDDVYLTNAFSFCVTLVILQVIVYALIRIDESKMNVVKGFCVSTPFVVASWACCIYSIRAIAKHSDAKEAQK